MADVHQDDSADLLDASIMDDDIESIQDGYQATDLHGDGNAEWLDRSFLELNIMNAYPLKCTNLDW